MTETQRKALQAAEDAFRRYADHHAMNGDETKARANMALAGQMAAALGEPDVPHKDSDRLAWLVTSGNVFDAFADVEKDRYDHAIDVALEGGRDEPSDADEVEGFRRLLDVAMAA